MKKTDITDEQCISKIINHMTEIKDCLIDFNIYTWQDLENSKYAKYTVTQLITNINELSKKLQDDTLQKFVHFKNIKLGLARNIASHDYEKVNFQIIYRILMQLTDEKIYSELKNYKGVDTNASNS